MKNVTGGIVRKRPGRKRGRRAKNCFEEWVYGFVVRHEGVTHYMWLEQLFFIDNLNGAIPMKYALPVTRAIRHHFLQHFKGQELDGMSEQIKREGLEALQDEAYELHKADILEHARRAIELWKYPTVNWYLPRTKKEKAMKEQAQAAEVQQVLDINKRMLYELKQLREDVKQLRDRMQIIEGKMDAMAYGGGLANRPSGGPAQRPSGARIMGELPAQAQLDSAPDPNEIPNAPVGARPGAQAGPGAAGDLGLVVRAKPAPGTRPQAAVKRHRVVEPEPGKAGVDIRNPSEFGDAMAFSDMMGGR